MMADVDVGVVPAEESAMEETPGGEVAHPSKKFKSERNMASPSVAKENEEDYQASSSNNSDCDEGDVTLKRKLEFSTPQKIMDTGGKSIKEDHVQDVQRSESEKQNICSSASTEPRIVSQIESKPPVDAVQRTEAKVESSKPAQGTGRGRGRGRTRRSEREAVISPPRRSVRHKPLTERQQLALAMKQSEDEAMLIDIHKRNASGETPLHQVVIKGDLTMAQRIVAQGAPVNVKDYAGWTPLHEACNHGYVEITKLLIKHGAHVSAPGCDNDTPLHDAAVNNHEEVVRALIEAGADVNARNRYDDTPIDVTSDPTVKALLIEAGAQDAPPRKHEHPINIETGRRLHKPSVPRMQYVNAVALESTPKDEVTQPRTAPKIKAPNPIEKPMAPVVRAPVVRQGSSAFGKAIANARTSRSQASQNVKRGRGKVAGKVNTRKLSDTPTSAAGSRVEQRQAVPKTEAKSVTKTEQKTNLNKAENKPVSKPATMKAKMRSAPRARVSTTGIKPQHTQSACAVPTRKPQEPAAQKHEQPASISSVSRIEFAQEDEEPLGFQTQPIYLDVLDRFFLASSTYSIDDYEVQLRGLTIESAPGINRIPEDLKQLYLVQMRSRCELQLQMAAELNRIRAAFDRDLRRSSSVYQMWQEEVCGKKDDNSEPELANAGAVELDIRDRYAESIADLTARHSCEADALLALQWMEWPAAHKHLASIVPPIVQPKVVFSC